ncbi:MAG: SDR family NAD(P)-dependent oxidoreductase [Burkholderiales bacterium]|jgi:short-subunit dehydrogenase|tara:strand:+ start:1897 stop:2673 length:777 start_codon:yes stop_codon:yes gene_type:complete
MFTSNKPIKDWSDRHVWIIGASEGIGLALGQALKLQQARLSVSARNENRLKDEFSGKARILPMDVSSTENVAHVMDLLIQEGTVPDTVFWLPAVYHPGGVLSLDPEATLKRLNINLVSAFNLFPRIVRYWTKHPLTNKQYHWSWFSSLAAYRGLPNASDYGASRSAISHLAQSSHLELKRYNIDVSLISPGFVNTRLTQKNEFKMPLLMSPERAAQLTIKGLKSGKFETHFPKRLSILFKFLNIIPIDLYLKIMRLLK